MVAIQLPTEAEDRLEALAKASGRSAASYAQDVLMEHLQDVEDLRVAEERLAENRAGRSASVPLADVMRKYGLSD